MKKRNFIGLLAVLFVVGCGGGGSKKPPVSTTSAPASNQGTTSVFDGDYFREYINYTCPSVVVEEKVVTVHDDVELLDAVANAKAGHTIIVANGTYRNVELILEACGTKENNIVIKADKVGRAVFSGMTTFRIVGSHVVIDGFKFQDGAAMSQTGVILAHGHHIRITNNEIDSFNSDDLIENKKWVGVYGKFVEVDHNYFHGKTSVGALLTVWRPTQEPNYAYIHDNHIADFSNPQEADNELEPIRIGTSEASQSDSYSIVERNYFSRVNGEIETISLKSGRNVIRNNTLVDSEGLFTSRHGSNNLFEGNFINPNYTVTGNDQGGGIRFYDGGHVIRNNYITGILCSSDSRAGLLVHSGNNPVNEENRYLNAQWTPHDVLLENNTVFQSRQSMLYDVKFGYDADNITLNNNFIYTSNGYPIIRKGVRAPFDPPRVPTNMSFDGNIFYGPQLANDPEYQAPQGMAYSNAANVSSYRTEGDIVVSTENDTVGARGVVKLSPEDVGIDNARTKQPDKTEFTRGFFYDAFNNWPTNKRELNPPSVLKQGIEVEFFDNNKTSTEEAVLAGISGRQFLPTDNDFVDIENNIGRGLNSQTNGSSMLRVKTNNDATKGRLTYMRFAIPNWNTLSKTTIKFVFTASFKGKVDETQPTTIYVLDDYEKWEQGRITWLNTPRHMADTSEPDLTTNHYTVNGTNHNLTAVHAGVANVGYVSGSSLATYEVNISTAAIGTDGTFSILMIDETKANIDIDFYSKERTQSSGAQRPFISVIA